MIAMPGKMTRWGALNIELRSKPSMVPHSGVWRFGPNPKNDNAAVSKIAVAIPKVPFTISGGNVFGRIRLRRIWKELPPKARDAFTKSIPFNESTLALVILA